MSSLKIKGRQRPKHPPTPYERTKRLVSKVRDWLTPVLWGTPKARSEEDEEVHREELDNEIDTAISEQFQQPGMSRAQGSQDGVAVDQVKDDGDSFVKEASDDDDDSNNEGTSTEKQNSEAQSSSGVRASGGLDNGIRPVVAAEVSALELDKKVNQLLSRSRTPVGKSLFGTHKEEVPGIQRHAAPFSAQSLSQLGHVNNHEEEHHHRSSTPTDTTMDSVSSTVPPPLLPIPSTQPFERLFSQSAVCTPGRTDTEESIKNSPFQSPFYRGKTSYGGASALSQPRAKRQRTELTSSLNQVVHYTVKARACDEQQQPFSSQTAKKILQTLETLSTPLSDARKFPLRATQLGSIGQAAKRHKHDPTSTVGGGISSPPTTPLVIPFSHSRQQGTVIVPSLVRGRGQLAPNMATVSLNRAEESPSQLNLPTKTLKLSEPVIIGTPLPANSTITTSTNVASSLAAITFSPKLDILQDKLNLPAAVSVTSTLRGNQPSSSSLPNLSLGRAPLQSLMSSSSPAPILGCSGAPGKIKAHSRQHYSASKDQPEEAVNTMEPPPPIPLTIGRQGSLPKFSFVPGLVVSTVPSTSTSSSAMPTSLLKPIADVTKMGSAFAKPLSLPTPFLKPFSDLLPVAVKSVGPSVGGQFAFSAPKELASISHPHLPKIAATKEPAFTFSAPNSCRAPGTQSSLPYVRPLLPAASKPSEVTKVPPPLLANGSVLDALRKPEFQPFGKGSSVSATKKEDVIDLTDDENRGGDKVEVRKPLQVVPTTANSSSLFGKAADLKSSDKLLDQSSTLKLGQPTSSSQPFGISGGLKIGGLSGPTASSSQPSTSLSGGLKIEGLNGPSSDSSLKLGGLGGQPIGGSQPSLSLGGGLKLGGLSGLTLPTPSAAARQEKNSEVAPPITSSTEFKLPHLAGPLLVSTLPSGLWECSCCMLHNKPEATSCIACRTAKPATGNSTSQPATDSTKLMALSRTGPPNADVSSLDNQTTNKGLLSLSEAKPLTAFAPSSGWECQVCLVMNKAEDMKCVACSSSKPGASSSGPTSSSSSGDLFQQKTQVTIPPVVFGDGGGIKLSLGGAGLTIAGIASLSSSASKKDVPTVKLGQQSIPIGSMIAASTTPTPELPSKLSVNWGVKACEADGGLKIGFAGTLPAFSSNEFQLASSKSGKEETIKASEGKLPSQPVFSLGPANFGAGTGIGSDKKGSAESSKGLFCGSIFAAGNQKLGEVIGGIKFAVPPASQDTPKTSAAGSSNNTSSQLPLSFNINALTNSASRVQSTSDEGGAGSVQKPFQLSGVGLGTIKPNSSSLTTSTEPRSSLSSISFAVPSPGITSVEPTTAASTIKLAAAPLQPSTSSSIGLFSSQPPALTFMGSFSSATSQPSVAPSFVGATAVAPSLGVIQPSQQSLTFSGVSNLFSSQSSSGTLSAPQSSSGTLSAPQLLSMPLAPPLFAGTTNPFLSQSSSMAPFVSPVSSSSLFNSTTTVSNIPFNFMATTDSAAKLGMTGSSVAMAAPPPTFKFSGTSSEASFKFGNTPAPSGFAFGAKAGTSDKPLANTFPSNLDTSTKAPLFPKTAGDINTQISAPFGASSASLQQAPQGGGLMFSLTPSFAFSSIAAGQQQQQLASINMAPGAGVFGSGLVGTSIITGQQQQPVFVGGQNVSHFGTGGGPALGGPALGGPQFGGTPSLFTAGQAATPDSSIDSNGMILGADVGGSNMFTPAPTSSRVFKKAIRKKH